MSLGIRVIAVGKKMPAWVQDGVEQYARRMPAHLKIEWIEIAPGDRARGGSAATARAAEGQAILSKLHTEWVVVALDERGKRITTKDLARSLDNAAMASQTLCLLVGGPDGLDSAVKSRANMTWSLSDLTLPHPMVRVLLTEQLYRAAMINQNHPYHRDG